jgi:hypothetical protein
LPAFARTSHNALGSGILDRRRAIRGIGGGPTASTAGRP